MSDDKLIESSFLKGLRFPEQPDLRDRFAMAALTGLCGNPMSIDYSDEGISDKVRCAYKLADAAMKAREK